MLENIRFPALQITGRVMNWCVSADQLCTCTPQALKNGWFNNQHIIDTLGQKFVVLGAELKRKTGKKLFKGLFAPQLIEVELRFSDGRIQVKLGTIKATIARAINADKGFFDSSGEDVDEILKSIEESTSVEEIWKRLGPLIRASPTRESSS
jgi:hypothetical protein